MVRQKAEKRDDVEHRRSSPNSTQKTWWLIVSLRQPGVPPTLSHWTLRRFDNCTSVATRSHTNKMLNTMRLMSAVLLTTLAALPTTLAQTGASPTTTTAPSTASGNTTTTRPSTVPSSSSVGLSGPPDVYLNVPKLHVGKIELDVDNLKADINLNAKVWTECAQLKTLLTLPFRLRA